MNPLAPPEFQFLMTAEDMAEQDTTVFIARDDDGQAVGMGALKRHDAAIGEIKRMFTTPAVRGKGAGRMILDNVEAEAHRKGLKKLVLETGSHIGFEPAWRVYERAGYTQCGAVLDYPASEYSRFYEKKLIANG